MLNNSGNRLLEGFNNVYKCVILAEVIPRNANTAVSIRSRNSVSVINTYIINYVIANALDREAKKERYIMMLVVLSQHYIYL